jgi:hypothetical protein
MSPDCPTSRYAHALAAALRAAERLLTGHGYRDVERSAEVLHVALEDAHGRPRCCFNPLTQTLTGRRLR